MAGVEWTPQARISLNEIAGYIAREAGRPKAAERIVRAIHAKSESYGRQPMMGSLHEELPEPLRFFLHKRYVVVYEPLYDGIRIHRVADSARDWTRIFRGSEESND